MEVETNRELSKEVIDKCLDMVKSNHIIIAEMCERYVILRNIRPDNEFSIYRSRDYHYSIDDDPNSCLEWLEEIKKEIIALEDVDCLNNIDSGAKIVSMRNGFSASYECLLSDNNSVVLKMGEMYVTVPFSLIQYGVAIQ